VQSTHVSDPPDYFIAYLEKLLRAVHRFPTTDLLYAIRGIIAKQSIQVLELVSEDTLVDFIKTCRLLTKDNNCHLHEAAIISINISTAVCDDIIFKAPGSRESIGSNTLGEWAKKLLSHVDGPKAPRLLHSIVARVMFFTSKNQNMPTSTRIKILDVACETLHRFRYPVRDWSAENPDVVDKVWRNAAGESLDFEAKLSAFAIAYKITPDGTHTENIEAVLGQIIQVLVSTEKPRVFYLVDRASFKVKQLTDALCFLSQNSCKSGVEMLLSIVNFMVAQCRKSDSGSKAYTTTHTAVLLLQALTESMVEYPSAFEILLENLDKQLFLEWTPWLPNVSAANETTLETNCRGKISCDNGIICIHNQLCHDLSLLLLQGVCTTAYRLSTKEFTFLQNQAMHEPKVDGKICEYPVDAERRIPHQQPTFVFAPRPHKDWRQLVLDIMADHVNGVCKELEDRCMNVEKPLRQSEAHAIQLQQELDQVRGRLDLVETTNTVTMEALRKADNTIIERNNEFNTLKQEIDTVRNYAEEQASKVAQLSSEIASLKQTHEKKVTNLQAAVSEAQRDLETGNMAERLAFEDKLDCEKQHIEQLAATVAWLESEKLKFLHEQKTEQQAYQERLRRMKADHEQAIDEGNRQVREAPAKFRIQNN
jgi:hypothetical protein